MTSEPSTSLLLRAGGDLGIGDDDVPFAAEDCCRGDLERSPGQRALK